MCQAVLVTFWALTKAGCLSYVASMSAMGHPIEATPNARQSEFWDQFPGLVWSNAHADDTTMIRAALSHPKFEQLVKIAAEFGLQRLRKEWRVLDQENTRETERAMPTVERVLRNIHQGFFHA